MLLAAALLAAVAPAFAGDLQPLGRATSAHDDNVLTVTISKSSIKVRPDGLRQYIAVSHFDKPRAVPDAAGKNFSWIVEPTLVNCKDRTSMSPMSILLSEDQKEVARFPTGETKLGQPPAVALKMRQATMAYACSYPTPGKISPPPAQK